MNNNDIINLILECICEREQELPRPKSCKSIYLGDVQWEALNNYAKQSLGFTDTRLAINKTLYGCTVYHVMEESHLAVI